MASILVRVDLRIDEVSEQLKRYDLKNFTYLYLAGERLDPDTYHWAKDLLGVPVIDHWWQTETGWPMCANLMAQSGYDGCMLDTLGVAPLTAGYCTALPINPATGVAWARPDWISATTQLSKSVRSTVSPSLR